MEYDIFEDVNGHDVRDYVRMNAYSDGENMLNLADEYSDRFGRDDVFRVYKICASEILEEGFWPIWHGFFPVLTVMRTQRVLEGIMEGEKALKPSWPDLSKWVESQL